MRCLLTAASRPPAPFADRVVAFDPGRPYRLHERVVLRPEPFGALAYHHGNRRLSFVRSPELVHLVRMLDRHPSARAAFDACAIEDRRWPSFERALDALAASEVLVAR